MEVIMMKKSKLKNQKKKWILFGTSAVVIVIIAVLTLATGNNSEPTAVETNATGQLVINKADITKTASFYPYESNGTYMEIIAVRANDDTVRTALNTCQVCYNSGRGYYEQLGDKLICNNCGNQFTIDQIERIKGGCNPVPILDEMKTEDIETITIDPEYLVAFEPLFTNWKR
ncbi:Fe-S-containing protein [Clostridium sediminicola]|uniref:Fe-S-containing protein n=1 Tax=Clostridium sediminicola TaxID=3114879 RepID=UPI003D1708C5